MESMDHVCERFERLEQQMGPWKQQTRSDKQRRRWGRLTWRVATMAVLGLALACPAMVQAEIFPCSAGDVQCLIDAINTANTNGTENTIRLQAGTYTLTIPDNDFNGLPVISSALTITGQGAETTILERATNVPGFRFLEVAPSGVVVLKHLTLEGGIAPRGAAIANNGTLTLRQSVLTKNFNGFHGALFNTGIVTIEQSTLSFNGGDKAGTLYNAAGGRVDITDSILRVGGSPHETGGVFNGSTGVVVITGSTLEDNAADTGSAVVNEGTLLITQSALIANHGLFFCGSTIVNGGLLEITNTTIAQSLARGGGCASAISNGDIAIVRNSTIADNVYRPSSSDPTGSALVSDLGATTVLENTILARNVVRDFDGSVVERSDCSGPVISLGHNLIGTTKGCTITLQPTDLTGDPGLDTFTDDGTPGNGHFPLLPTSQAIDAGNDVVCPRIDQLGQRRIGPCDIGAIRFLDNSDLEPKDDLATAA